MTGMKGRRSNHFRTRLFSHAVDDRVAKPVEGGERDVNTEATVARPASRPRPALTIHAHACGLGVQGLLCSASRRDNSDYIIFDK